MYQKYALINTEVYRQHRRSIEMKDEKRMCRDCKLVKRSCREHKCETVCSIEGSAPRNWDATCYRITGAKNGQVFYKFEPYEPSHTGSKNVTYSYVINGEEDARVQEAEGENSGEPENK